MTARNAPAAARNRAAILEVLRKCLPERGTVLEIASGTGEHAVWFAAALPGVAWCPTDRDPDALASIVAHRETANLANLRAPKLLDVCIGNSWPIESPAEQIAAIVCINMIHIAPWAATDGLMAVAETVLPAGGLLYLYGPFREQGRHSTPSNAAFDADLRGRDRAWGVRDLEDVASLAARHGLTLIDRVPMPANNLSLVFRKDSFS